MHINFKLPLEEPVLVFALILFVILFMPILLNRFKIPPIIGLIVSGIIVGPNGLNLLARNSSIILFGTVGLLYIMFLAGLEIDLNEFKKNKFKSIGFGAYTFFIPMILGTTVFYFLLNYSLISSLLTASMFASHTLLTYPMVSKLGIAKNLAVNTAVGGTMITDTAALLVLAVIAGSAKGEIDAVFWVRLSISIVIFAAVVLLVLPMLSRWFFKNNSDSVSQYIFVLGIVFLSSFLALLAGVEAIIGAFLAGLALNRLIPHTSPLMNRIEFVGNALFIPFFLIGVGMLIDYKVIFSGWDALIVTIAMTVIALSAKYFAAIATQKTFKFTKDEGLIIFGLSNSQAAATLAAVLIGYNLIIGKTETGDPIRLLDENILNGTIIMILVTCTVSSFATQKAAIKIAKDDLKNNPPEESEDNESTLVGLANEATVESLIQLAISTIDKKQSKEIYGLHIITADAESPETVSRAKKLLENAEKFASSADFTLHPLIRYDNNVASGIINTVKEKNIKHFYIGLHQKSALTDTFFGNLTAELLSKNDSSIYIHKSFQPLSTLKKFVLVIPANAELEQGFNDWYFRVVQIAANTGNRFEVFANAQTIEYLQNQKKVASNIHFNEFESFEDFLVIAREVSNDTMLIINLARKDGVSWQPAMERIGTYLNKYFKKTSFMLVYPNNFAKTGAENPYANPSLQGNLMHIKGAVENIFKRK
jgi:Kef-type K+ transport system membrane component KefB